MITNGRVKELRRLLAMGRTLGDSARMAEMSEKTARKYRDSVELPSQRLSERKYRTRISNQVTGTYLKTFVARVVSLGRDTTFLRLKANSVAAEQVMDLRMLILTRQVAFSEYRK